jgi:hypothetical protein
MISQPGVEHRAEQGRKFGCFAILAAQAWQVDAAGCGAR